MKILSAEETQKIMTLNNGRETRISAQIKQLQVGESLHVEKTDWKAKYNIARMPKRIGVSTGRQFSCGRMPDGNGWLIVRLG